MLWYYEDEEIFASDDGSDIKYDAEVMNSFTDALCSDLDRYRERARALEKEYVRYHNNDTFVGEMADDSKRFIYDVQGDELHMKNLELKREFLNLCLSIENKFKEEVDPSPKARVSVGILSKIKNDYNRVYNAADTKGYELECHGKQVVDILGRWGISTVPYCRRLVESLDDFCGHGKMLDKDIQKLESFDREACALIDRKDLTGYANDLQRKIKHTAGVLDSMTVYQPDVAKNSVGLVSLSTATAIWNPFKKFFGSKKSVDIKKSAYTDEEVIQSLKNQYGFTEKQAKLINDAYKKYNRQCFASQKEMSNDQKIKEFFSNLAALNNGYGTNIDVTPDIAFKHRFTLKPGEILEDAKENYEHNVNGNIKKIKGNFTAFNMLGTNPSTKDAINFFNDLGINGQELKEALDEQHKTCADNEKRDFVHECAIFAVMADGRIKKESLDALCDIDAAIGYKGDVYSGFMKIDDKKSDVEAYNLYYRMKECDDGDIWDTMTEYNIGVEDESINGSIEFLKHFGEGDAKEGMERLKEDLDKKTLITGFLSKDTTPEEVETAKKEFLDYLSEQSGVKVN